MGYIGIVWQTEGLDPHGDVMAVENSPGCADEWLMVKEGGPILRQSSTVFATREEALIDGWCQLLAQQLAPIREAFMSDPANRQSPEHLTFLASADIKIHAWQSDVEHRMHELDEGVNPFTFGNPYRTLLDLYLPFIEELRSERNNLEHEIQAEPDISSNVVS